MRAAALHLPDTARTPSLLTDDLFNELVEAASLAPSADNMQAWEFGVNGWGQDMILFSLISEPPHAYGLPPFHFRSCATSSWSCPHTRSACRRRCSS